MSNRIHSVFTSYKLLKQTGHTLAIMFVLIVMAVPIFGQTVVGTISKPGMQPTAVAVNEAEGKVILADNSTGNLYIYDEDTLEEIDYVFVGKETYDIVIHQGTGKVYAASRSEKKVTVVDTNTYSIITEISTAYYTQLAVDDNLGKVYILFHEPLFGNGFMQVDVETDSIIKIPNIAGKGTYRDIAINPVTHEVYISNYLSSEMDIIDGVTLEHTTLGYGAGRCGPGVAVNWLENKVYISTGGGVGVPFVVYDRNNGTHKFLYTDNDALHFAYNPANNRMYTSSEVNHISAIIEGKSDEFFNLPMLGGAYAIAVCPDTSHIFFANQDYIVMLDDQTQMVEYIQVDDTIRGGIIITRIAINQTTGRVYVINDGLSLNFVTILQDTEMLIRPPVHICSASMWIIDPISQKIVEKQYLSGINGESLAVRPGGGRVYIPSTMSNVLSIHAGAGSKTEISSVETGGDWPLVPAFMPDGRHIYVTNSNSNNVGVIDVEANSLIDVIPVGAKPIGVAVTTDGTKAYVANKDDNTVSVIDTETKSVFATIFVGEKPMGVAVNPSSTKVYVVNSESKSVSVIDITSDSVVETIEVEYNPYWAAISPDGMKLFVTNRGPDTVSIIDTGTDKVVNTVNVGSNPEAIGVLPDGSAVYVLNEYKGLYTGVYVSIIDTSDYSVIDLEPIDFSTYSGGIAIPDPTSKFAGRAVAGDSPINGALVRAFQEGEEKGSATTNKSGDYCIFNLKSGTYDIEITAPDYFSQAMEDQAVEVGRTTLVDFSLLPYITVSSPNGGETWEVSSSHAI
ncbi:MAG: carboxypeptidase regulatory-like domain-containing protein, partial [Desulfobacteraceae bacterium]|nr:carboxypeptidase regulatory-like domain-containing protein [Desulfobacteraceae bacterium]